MSISIITWKEGYYDDYLQIMKNNSIIYYGYWYSILSKKKYMGLELNYGIKNNKCDTILTKYKENFFTIPDKDEIYKYNYDYIPVKFNKKELLKIISKDEIKDIRKINYFDLIIEWVKLSGIKDYFTTLEEYKKYLKRDIYYIEIDEINSKIEELFEVLFEMKNKKIVEIESKNYEIVNVYLNSGIIWKAFLRNGEKIYLNTEFQISLDVTDIFNKYGD